MAAMDTKEKRKYDAEQRKQERLKADLESEQLLRDEIEYEKRLVQSVQPGKGLIMIERLRGLVRLESGDTTQDYQLVVTFNEIQLKGMKNQAKRLDDNDYGFLAYGRNLHENGEQMIREVLKTCKSQLREKQVVRTIADLKKDEIEKIQEENNGAHLPDGWYFDGRMYMNCDGEYKTEHPNLEFLCKQYLAAENGVVGDYNRSVMKDLQEEQQKFE